MSHQRGRHPVPGAPEIDVRGNPANLETSLGHHLCQVDDAVKVLVKAGR